MVFAGTHPIAREITRVQPHQLGLGDFHEAGEIGRRNMRGCPFCDIGGGGLLIHGFANDAGHNLFEFLPVAETEGIGIADGLADDRRPKSRFEEEEVAPSIDRPFAIGAGTTRSATGWPLRITFYDIIAVIVTFSLFFCRESKFTTSFLSEAQSLSSLERSFELPARKRGECGGTPWVGGFEIPLPARSYSLESSRLSSRFRRVGHMIRPAPERYRVEDKGQAYTVTSAVSRIIRIHVRRTAAAEIGGGSKRVARQLQTGTHQKISRSS